jgi:hypothetical protein
MRRKMVDKIGKYTDVDYEKAVARVGKNYTGKSKRPLMPDTPPDLKQAAADERVWTNTPKAAPTKFKYGRT